jgi:hypothetical protein
MYDVVLLAHHFGTRHLTALYRLRNLGYLTEAELARLVEQEVAGMGTEAAALLAVPEIDREAAQNAFRQRFLRLGLEAWRRDKITRAKLVELARMVEVSSTELALVLQDVVLDNREEVGDVVFPGA